LYCIRINVTKYDVTFTTKDWVLIFNPSPPVATPLGRSNNAEVCWNILQPLEASGGSEAAEPRCCGDFTAFSKIRTFRHSVFWSKFLLKNAFFKCLNKVFSCVSKTSDPVRVPPLVSPPCYATERRELKLQ